MSINSNGQTLNLSMAFYYLDVEEESAGYELYNGGGYIGFTPGAHVNEMGIFNLMRNN